MLGEPILARAALWCPMPTGNVLNSWLVKCISLEGPHRIILANVGVVSLVSSSCYFRRSIVTPQILWRIHKVELCLIIHQFRLNVSKWFKTGFLSKWWTKTLVESYLLRPELQNRIRIEVGNGLMKKG